LRTLACFPSYSCWKN